MIGNDRLMIMLSGSYSNSTKVILFPINYEDIDHRLKMELESVKD